MGSARTSCGTTPRRSGSVAVPTSSRCRSSSATRSPVSRSTCTRRSSATTCSAWRLCRPSFPSCRRSLRRAEQRRVRRPPSGDTGGAFAFSGATSAARRSGCRARTQTHGPFSSSAARRSGVTFFTPIGRKEVSVYAVEGQDVGRPGSGYARRMARAGCSAYRARRVRKRRPCGVGRDRGGARRRPS